MFGTCTISQISQAISFLNVINNYFNNVMFPLFNTKKNANHNFSFAAQKVYISTFIKTDTKFMINSYMFT